MFDIGWSEMVVIGVVALVAIGPKQLPGALRTAGHWVGRARKMASDFQGQFQEALREADVAEMKKQFDDAASSASSITSPNLLGSVKQDIEDALKLEAPKSDTAANGASATTAMSEPAATAADVVQDIPAPAPEIDRAVGEPATAVSDKRP